MKFVTKKLCKDQSCQNRNNKMQDIEKYSFANLRTNLNFKFIYT